MCSVIGKECASIQLAQCQFPELVISSAKILICFSNKIYGSSLIKQHWETVIVWNYQNADYSLRKNLLCNLLSLSAHFHSLLICYSNNELIKLTGNSILCARLSVLGCLLAITHTHTHPFNGPLSGTTQVSPYQKGKTNLDFTEARDCEWQWHQLGHMQVCTSLQTDNHTSTPPLSTSPFTCH